MTNTTGKTKILTAAVAIACAALMCLVAFSGCEDKEAKKADAYVDSLNSLIAKTNTTDKEVNNLQATDLASIKTACQKYASAYEGYANEAKNLDAPEKVTSENQKIVDALNNTAQAFKTLSSACDAGDEATATAQLNTAVSTADTANSTLNSTISTINSKLGRS